MPKPKHNPNPTTPDDADTMPMDVSESTHIPDTDEEGDQDDGPDFEAAFEAEEPTSPVDFTDVNELHPFITKLLDAHTAGQPFTPIQAVLDELHIAGKQVNEFLAYIRRLKVETRRATYRIGVTRASGPLCFYLKPRA